MSPSYNSTHTRGPNTWSCTRIFSYPLWSRWLWCNCGGSPVVTFLCLNIAIVSTQGIKYPRFHLTNKLPLNSESKITYTRSKRMVVLVWKGASIMNNKPRRKCVTLVTFCILFALGLAITPSLGYGTSFEDADLLPPDSYIKTLASIHESAYYKISCSLNDELSLSLTPHDWPVIKLAIYLYNSTYHLVDHSADGLVHEDIEHTCLSGGYYYIQINRSEGAGTTDFTLSIIGSTGGQGIPSFALFSATLGLLCALGITFATLKRQNISR